MYAIFPKLSVVGMNFQSLKTSTLHVVKIGFKVESSGTYRMGFEAEQLHSSHASLNATQKISCRGVKISNKTPEKQ